MTVFKDHFTHASDRYQQFRPTYPEALYAWLAQITPRHGHVWDCATGNGQAALALAGRFARVTATDAGANQVAQAPGHPGITFRVATAENSGLPDHSVDLITVAQAVHWFDLPAFYDEVRRVAAPQTPCVVWGYTFYRINETFDQITDQFSEGLLKGYWPPERAILDRRLEDIQFPFSGIQIPEIAMTAEWDLAHLLGYLDTWSGCKNYRKQHNSDPLDHIRPALTELWGDPTQTRTVSWPLVIKAGWVD